MMPRKVDDLEAHGEKFWPAVLSQREQDASIIPKLIESQEKFIGILYVADASPTAWKDVLSATKDMPANLFLKHLMLLTDVSGERLQRIRSNIGKFFPKGAMTYHWKDADWKYAFGSLNVRRTWSNDTLKVNGALLLQPEPMSPLMEDVAMLLIHGASSIDAKLPDVIAEKCGLGALIGCKSELDAFVRQRYIYVSRITGGATANAMGQLCQAYVKERLQSLLPTWDFSGHNIPGISQNDGRTDTTFDIVAQSPKGKCCAIEVSFQVTTNSTIERKAGQAVARRELLHKSGHKVAYVIDGAGNFQRRSALKVICDNSDCTVSFKDKELESLAKFLKTIK